MLIAILAAALTGQCAGGGCGAGYGYAYRPTYSLPAYGYCTYQVPPQVQSVQSCTPYTWYTYAPTAAVPAVEARYQTGGPKLPSPQTQQAPQAPPKSTP